MRSFSRAIRGSNFISEQIAFRLTFGSERWFSTIGRWLSKAKGRFRIIWASRLRLRSCHDRPPFQTINLLR